MILIRSCKLKNVGDSMNSELVRLISDETPTIVNNKFTNPNNETIYMCIGSVLGWVDSSTEVWGTGFISNSQFITSIPKPKKIHAVRGPLTRELLLKKGIDCPAIYGDPALLVPYFYRPEITVEHELGFIPHHIDKVMIPQLKKQFPEAHFIDIQLDIYKFVNEVLKCKKIVTSSLHGQIIADAYNIPNAWIKLSDKVLGNGWKFQDYFASVGRRDKKPLIWRKGLTIEKLRGKLILWNSAEIDLKPLWESCPFRKEENDLSKM